MLVLAAVTACTGSSPPPPRAAVREPSPPTPAPPEPPPDLSPVPEPKSLLLVARLDRDALGRLPLRGSLRDLANAPLDALAPELPSSLNELVTSAPLELAVALDSPEALLLGGPDLVWSLPLVSFEGALTHLREREGQGELSLERKGPGVVALGAGSRACLLSVALGPAPARLVCAERRATLDALGPWAARGLPTRTLGPEPLVVEAWPQRFAREHRDKLAALLRFVAPASAGPTRWTDQALSVLGRDGLDLLGDVKQLRLSAAEQSGALVLELSADLDGERSWFARTVGSMPPKTAGVSELFGRLPPSTDAAFFFSGAEPARSDEARAAFSGWLAAELGPSVPRATLDLVAATFIQRVPHVYAHGDAYDRDVGYGRQSGRALWEKTRSTYGWHLIGFDEPAKAFLPKLDQGMRAYNTGSLHAFAYRTLPRLCRGLGKIRKKPAPRTLPAGSVVYELPLPGKFFDDCMKGRGVPPEPAPNDAIVVVLMPLGERSFIGFGLQEREMIARMRAVAQSSAGASAEKDADVRLGGYVSLAGVGGLLRFVSMAEHWDWERRRLARLPNQGKDRAVFAVRVQKSGAPSRTRVVAELKVPEAMLKDAAAR